MIRDIRLLGCEFLKKAFLPLDSSRNFHLFYVFDGNGFLIVDSSSHACHSGDLFLFPSVEIAIPQHGTHSTLTILHLSFSTNSENMLLELQHLPCHLPSEARFKTLFMELLHEYTLQQHFYQDMCSFYLERILLPCIVNAKRQQKLAFLHTPTAKSDNVLYHVCDYIEHHLTEDLSSERLCSITNLNPRQLNNLFKSFYRQSTVEYIGTRRLAKAKELLHFFSYSVTEIAECTGFNSVHYFSLFFKKKEGITPSEYKKRLGDSLIS